MRNTFVAASGCDCAQWRGDLGVYLIGALDEAEHAGLERHLRACEWCRAEYEDLIPVRDLLGRLAVAAGPSDRPRLRPRR
jgi:anti-sigma factor RsiW